MSLEDLLKTLHQEYVASLPEKLSNIDELVRNQDLPALRSSFHKLKGTGMTYGLPEISQLGQATEEVFIHKPAQGLQAANLALAILRDVHQCRLRHKAYDCLADPRFKAIQKLLQN